MTRHRPPKFETCMRMMRRHNAAEQEEGFALLAPHAHVYLPELLAEFKAETVDHGLRCWLLELIGMAGDPSTIAFFTQELQSNDASFREWARRGLLAIDVAEARTALYEAGLHRRSQT